MALRLRLPLAAAAIAVTSMALAGCSVLGSAPDPNLNLTTADVVYLDDLGHSDFSLNSSAASMSLITDGRNTCAALNKGETVPAAVKALLGHYYPNHASEIVVAAINSYCPQHTALLNVPA